VTSFLADTQRSVPSVSQQQQEEGRGVADRSGTAPRVTSLRGSEGHGRRNRKPRSEESTERGNRRKSSRRPRRSGQGISQLGHSVTARPPEQTKWFGQSALDYSLDTIGQPLRTPTTRQSRHVLHSASQTGQNVRAVVTGAHEELIRS